MRGPGEKGKQPVNAVIAVAQIVAPVFTLALIGYLWVRAGWDYDTTFVTRLAMTLSVPCLIFVALVEAEIDPRALRDLTLASFTAYTVVIASFWALIAALGMDRRTWLAPLAFGNTGNLGLPLALFAFGEAGLTLAVVVFAVMAVLSFTVGVWLVSGGGSPARALGEPIVAATILGAACLWFGIVTPPVVTETLRLVGQMAIPLMLITLGVAVARLRPRSLGRPAALSAVKVALCAGIAWAAGAAFALPEVARAVLVLQVATPAAVTSYLLAVKYGADADAVAGLVAVSTVMSVAALPVLLGILL